MQYILTETELNDLKDKARRAEHLPTPKQLQELCTKIADEMPVLWGWGPGETTPVPWGCILSKATEWYCDECPVRKLCEHAKHYSK